MEKTGKFPVDDFFNTVFNAPKDEEETESEKQDEAAETKADGDGAQQ